MMVFRNNNFLRLHTLNRCKESRSAVFFNHSSVRTFLRTGVSLLALCFFIVKGVGAQVFSYSLPLELPVFVNPAHVGNAGMMRFGSFYKNQWLNTNSPYTSYGVSFDRPFGLYYNHAIGATLTNDVQGDYVLQHTALNLFYSFMIDVTYDFRLRIGVQGGAMMKAANYNKLVFPDMLSTDGAAREPLNYANKKRFTYDFGVGVAGEYQLLDFGLAVHHLAEPHFGTRNIDRELRLPRKISGYGAMRFNIFEMYRFKTPFYICPSLHAAYQSRDISKFEVGARELSVTAGLKVEYIGVHGGLYYQNSVFYSRQTISAAVGWTGENFSIAYGYNMGFMENGFRGLDASEHEVAIGIKIPLSQRPRLAKQLDKKRRVMTKYSRKRTGAKMRRKRRGR